MHTIATSVGFKTRAFLVIIMVPKILDIIRVLNDIAPPSLAEEWDNIGLQLGDPTGSVKKNLGRVGSYYSCRQGCLRSRC